MKLPHSLITAALAATLFSPFVYGQHQASSASAAPVPRLVNFSGKAIDGRGDSITGVLGVTFAIYEDQYGGAPLWIEAQNVAADATGNYKAQLGANTPEGLPLELFSTGAARWLGVRFNGGEEQPRVFLLSVPYALKAADAETVGGLPASAFVLASPANRSPQANALPQNSPGVITPQVSGTGTSGTIPKWTDNSGGLGNSVIVQSGTGSTAKIGINAATPDATLDVNGSAIVRGNLNLPSSGNATAAAGLGSQLVAVTASAFNSATNAAVSQKFAWQAIPSGNNTANPGGAMALLYGAGSNPIKQTGLSIAGNGQITFAAGQAFPAATFTGNETVTGSVSATQLISTAPQGTPPLQVNSNTMVPNLNANFLGGQPASAFATTGSNIFTGSQIFAGNVGIGTSSPIQALDLGSTNSMIIGVDPGSDTAQAYGGYILSGRASGGTANLWRLLTAPVGGGFGVPPNSFSIWQYPPTAQPACCLQRLTILPAQTSSDTGGTVTIDQNGNIDQPRTAGGAVKAMFFFSPFNGGRFVTCYNSTLTGAAATTPPCGFTIIDNFRGDYILDLGFKVDDRILSATGAFSESGWVAACTDLNGDISNNGFCQNGKSLTPNQVELTNAGINSCGGSGCTTLYYDNKIYLIVY